MTRKAWRFFMANAGGIVGERAICAARLARAEERLRADDCLRVRWERDNYADLSWMSDEERRCPHEVAGCIVERYVAECDKCGRPGFWEHAGSLWGIVDADASYRRVVEAELACEVLS